MTDLELQKKYEDIEARIFKGADYLDNPFLEEPERTKANRLYDFLCEEYLQIKEQMKERGLW